MFRVRYSFAVAAQLGIGLLASFSALGAPTASHGTGTNSLPLAQSERVYIANIETRALTLNQRGFPALTRAIKTGDLAQAKFLFAPDFKGETLPFGEQPNYKSEAVTIFRVTNATNSARPAGPSLPSEDFARGLLDFRKRFAGEPRVELALMSLSPESRDKIDGAWKGSCALRLVGTRVAGGKEEIMAKFEFDLA